MSSAGRRHRIASAIKDRMLRLVSSPVRDDADFKHLVQLAFESYLGRLPDEEGEQAYVTALRNGLSLSNFISIIIDSQEYRQKNGIDSTRNSEPAPCVMLGTNTRLTEDMWNQRKKALKVDQHTRSSTDEHSTAPRAVFHHSGEYLVSAIASLYRGGQHISFFLENITSQTIFDRSELIIIDANSPDGEEALITNYMKHYPNINYKRINYRIGIYDAWNEGVRLARGKYLTNTNLDDVRRPDSFAFQSRSLENAPAIDVVYQDCFYSLDPNLTFEAASTLGFKSNMQIVTLRSLLRANWPHHAPMWRAALHKDVGMFDVGYRSAGDYEFWLRCAAKGKQFLKLDEALSVYYHNPAGVSTSADSAGVVEGGRIQREYLKRLRALEFAKNYPPRGIQQ